MNHIVKIWKHASLRKKASIIAGIISAFAFAYVGFADVWHLPFAEEIFRSGKILVSTISLLLGAFTLNNLSQEVQLIDEVGATTEEEEEYLPENYKDERYGEK